MFKSKASKTSKQATPTAEQSAEPWSPTLGNQDQDVGSPPIGSIPKETPWVSTSKSSGKKSGRNKPRTSSLSQLDAPPDRATEVIEKHAMNRAFERMLDELQIPSATRSKLSTLDTPVKAAMLKSSHVLNLEAAIANPNIPGTHRAVRKSKSSVSLETKQNMNARPQSMFSDDIPFEPREPAASFSAGSGAEALEVLDRPWMRHEFSSSTSSLGRSSSPTMPGSTNSSASRTTQSSGNDKSIKERKEKQPIYSKELAPETFATMLQKTYCTDLDVDRLKKLRIMLRNESAGWTELFIRARGYSALISTVADILNVEWREEQRDDKILHELLRCLKALSTSSIGCFALRSLCPTPWDQLMVLWYSDKKPGDLATRQQMVDFLHILFELYPSSKPVPPQPSAPNSVSSRDPKRNSANLSIASSGLPRPPRALTPPPSATSPSPTYQIPTPHSSLFSLVRSLLLTEPPAPAEQIHEPIKPHSFIESLHVPRIYKTYLQELSDVCRDYFWIFCHPQNTIWKLDEVDVERVEAPRAPGGMTGGVEFEAVGYMTSHLKFVNLLAGAAAEPNLPRTDELSAYRFHSDLFASGFERILTTSRKASTVYYPTLHLEVARYVVAAAQSGYELPWSLLRYVGLPPANVLKASMLDTMAGSKGSAKVTVSGARASPTHTPPGSPGTSVKTPGQKAGPLPQIGQVSPLR